MPLFLCFFLEFQEHPPPPHDHFASWYRLYGLLFLVNFGFIIELNGWWWKSWVVGDLCFLFGWFFCCDWCRKTTQNWHKHEIAREVCRRVKKKIPNRSGERFPRSSFFIWFWSRIDLDQIFFIVLINLSYSVDNKFILHSNWNKKCYKCQIKQQHKGNKNTIYFPV